MKFSLALALFVAFFAFALAADVCNPDDNGQPTCSGSSAQLYRNNWDPTAYWQCNGSTAELVRCPSQTLFLESEQKCVVWNTWVWVNPCGYP